MNAAQHLQAVLQGLLDVARTATPVTADDVRRHLGPRTVRITQAGPDLAWPTWADRTSGADDLYFELSGWGVTGARVPPLRPGHGQYVDLFVARCTLADVEAVVGPLQPSVKVHWDDPDRSIADVAVGGQDLRVLVETGADGSPLVVTVHFSPG